MKDGGDGEGLRMTEFQVSSLGCQLGGDGTGGKKAEEEHAGGGPSGARLCRNEEWRGDHFGNC